MLVRNLLNCIGLREFFRQPKKEVDILIDSLIESNRERGAFAYAPLPLLRKKAVQLTAENRLRSRPKKTATFLKDLGYIEMGRNSNRSVTYDSALCLRLRTLIAGGHLSREYSKANIYWTVDGRQTSDIGFFMTRKNLGDTAELELNYNVNGQPVNYTTQLESIPSNLGKGRVWYFICAKTGKRCRRLYLMAPSRLFLHREAYRGIYYDTQVRSKYERFLDRTLGAMFKEEKLLDELSSKGFTKYYAGKETKRYLRLQKKLSEVPSGISARDLEAILYR
jgi:hypothetical protein